ncbi:MAG: hypothetical protein SGPRY_009714 [Prymnesium sp.]
MARTAPLVRHEDGKWIIIDEGAALLSSLPAPLCIVACAGMYRTGKSFFLNSLAGSTGARASSGFRVGSTSESCTRGIDVCLPAPTATIAPKCGGTLVLLDTEGIASMDQDESYDAQVFAIALLLSSYFVLNSMGVIDEAAIDRLYLVAELTKHVSVHAIAPVEGEREGEADDEATCAPASELSTYFPPMLWLLRDFVLDLEAEGKQISEQEYMESALAERPGSARRSEERNSIRAAIRGLFPSRCCRTLVRPVSSEEELRSAVSLSPEQASRMAPCVDLLHHEGTFLRLLPLAQPGSVANASCLPGGLRPEFVSALANVRSLLLETAPVKTMNNSPLDGAMVLSLARQYLGAMNTPRLVPSIKSAWEFVVSERCAAAAGGARELAVRHLSAAVSTSPLLDAGGWEVAARKAEVAAWAHFKQHALQGAANTTSRSELKADLAKEVAAHKRALWDASASLSDSVASVVAANLPAPSVVAAEVEDDSSQLSAAIISAVKAYEADAQGPGLADGFSRLLREHIAPWLVQVCSALAARSGAAREAAAATLAAEVEARSRVEAQLQQAEAEVRGQAEVSRQLEARLGQLDESLREERRRGEVVGLELEQAREDTRGVRAELKEAQELARREAAMAASAAMEAQREAAEAASLAAASLEEARRETAAYSATSSQWERECEGVRRELHDTKQAAERQLAAMLERAERAERVEAESRVELSSERSQATQLARELQASHERTARVQAEVAEVRAEAEREISELQSSLAEARKDAQQLRAQMDEAGGRVEQAEASLACARAEVAALSEAAQLSSAAKATLELELQAARAEASCEGASAKQAGEAQRALLEERDALKAQLANFHERLAVLPEFYVQQVFGGEKMPEDLVDALTEPPVLAPGELQGRAEELATRHLGNIACARCPLLPRPLSLFSGRVSLKRCCVAQRCRIYGHWAGNTHGKANVESMDGRWNGRRACTSSCSRTCRDYICCFSSFTRKLNA